MYILPQLLVNRRFYGDGKTIPTAQDGEVQAFGPWGSGFPDGLRLNS